MISVRNLTYSYPKRSKPALNDVSFDVEPGQIFSILGPNGAGKTTLIRILSTLIIPAQGTVRVNGFDAVTQDSKVRRSIGLACGSERTFYFRMTGFQNLEFFGSLLGLSGKALKRQVEEVLEKVGLAEACDLLFMKFSSGMKRKLAIARALLVDPPVYFFDEPTSSIDPLSAVNIRKMIQEFRNENKTILLATHNTEEANKLSDLVGILDQGKIVALDAPGNLLGRYNPRVVEAIFDSPPEQTNHEFRTLVKSLNELPEVTRLTVTGSGLLIKVDRPESDITAIFKLITGSGIRLQKINTKELTLEDVFVQLVDKSAATNARTAQQNWEQK